MRDKNMRWVISHRQVLVTVVFGTMQSLCYVQAGNATSKRNASFEKSLFFASDIRKKKPARLAPLNAAADNGRKCTKTCIHL